MSYVKVTAGVTLTRSLPLAALFITPGGLLVTGSSHLVTIRRAV